VGELGLAELALVVLFFETTGFGPLENAGAIGFAQMLMGTAIAGHFRLVFALGAIFHG
jgi:hypothetical protein